VREPPTPSLQPVGPRPIRLAPPPRSTAWFRPTYVPRGWRRNAAGEYPQQRLGPPIPGALSFRGPDGGKLTVSVNPQLNALDVDREARSYPTVRVVRVHDRAGLLFPARSGNFSSGLTWLEQPGVVAQVIGFNVADAELLRVAEGLRITTVGGQPTIAAGALPAGWQPTPPGEPTKGAYELVLPRTHIQHFTQANPNQGPSFSISETRDRYEPLPSSPRPSVTVRGHPAVVTRDARNHRITITWREPGGIELSVSGDQQIGQRTLLAIAQGLRQP
jgi:hypothetical protein